MPGLPTINATAHEACFWLLALELRFGAVLCSL